MCDIRGTLRLINSLLGKQSKSNGTALLIDGSEVYKPQLVANHVNNHIPTVVKKQRWALHKIIRKLRKCAICVCKSVNLILVALQL